MENSLEVAALLGSPCPLIVAEARDEESLLRAIRTHAGRQELQVWIWSGLSGLSRDGHTTEYGTSGLPGALARIREVPGPAFFVLCGAVGLLTNPLTLRRLDDTVRSLEPGQTVVVQCPDGDVPAALTALAEDSVSAASSAD